MNYIGRELVFAEELIQAGWDIETGLPPTYPLIVLSLNPMDRRAASHQIDIEGRSKPKPSHPDPKHPTSSHSNECGDKRIINWWWMKQLLLYIATNTLPYILLGGIN